MRVINNDRAAIILSLVTSYANNQFGGKMHKVAAGVKKVTLKPGANNVELSDKDMETLLATASIEAYIAEGTLRFPDIKELEEIYSTKQADIRKRMARISKAPAPEDEENADQSADNAKVTALESQVAALTALVEAAGLSEKPSDEGGKSTEPKTAKKKTKKVGNKAKAADADKAGEGDKEGGA